MRWMLGVLAAGLLVSPVAQAGGGHCGTGGGPANVIQSNAPAKGHCGDSAGPANVLQSNRKRARTARPGHCGDSAAVANVLRQNR